MPRYPKETQIIVSLDGKIAGWTSVEGGTGTFHGDKTLTKKAKIACVLETTTILYEKIQLQANANTAEGAYAAFASYGLERLEIIQAPVGFLQSLGLDKTQINEDEIEYILP